MTEKVEKAKAIIKSIEGALQRIVIAETEKRGAIRAANEFLKARIHPENSAHAISDLKKFIADEVLRI